jgi:hypothetical protein
MTERLETGVLKPEGGRGDAANTILAAVGYNFSRLIRWLSIIARVAGGVLVAGGGWLLAAAPGDRGGRERSHARPTQCDLRLEGRRDGFALHRERRPKAARR